jgi:hypothetical protein
LYASLDTENHVIRKNNKSNKNDVLAILASTPLIVVAVGNAKPNPVTRSKRVESVAIPSLIHHKARIAYLQY